MKIAIGSDHGGFELKQLLVKKLAGLGHEVNDLGCGSAAAVDYPDFAEQVCAQVLDATVECGMALSILISANARDQEISVTRRALHYLCTGYGGSVDALALQVVFVPAKVL